MHGIAGYDGTPIVFSIDQPRTKFNVTHAEASSFAGLQGKTALVTGSTSGIGRSIALELARAGANVMIHGARSEPQAQAVAAEVESCGVHSHVRMCDFQDQASAISRLANDVWNWRDGLDILVNNAGVDVLTGRHADESFDQKLARLWHVDVQATVRLCRNLGQRMRTASGGAIVNIGWDQATLGMAGESGEMFAATKGAIMAFTASLAKSLAPQVRVNCIAPGWIKTAWGKSASESWQARAVQESLLQRWGSPDDVARAVRFLVSNEASFITGQTLCVNGGRSQ